MSAASANVILMPGSNPDTKHGVASSVAENDELHLDCSSSNFLCKRKIIKNQTNKYIATFFSGGSITSGETSN